MEYFGNYQSQVMGHYMGFAELGGLLPLFCYTALMDIKTMRIENKVCAFVAIMGGFYMTVKMWFSLRGMAFAMEPGDVMFHHGAGAVLLGGAFFLLALATGGIGGGDLKFMTAAGFALGGAPCGQIAVVGFLLSGLFAAGWMLFSRIPNISSGGKRICRKGREKEAGERKIRHCIPPFAMDNRLPFIPFIFCAAILIFLEKSLYL